VCKLVIGGSGAAPELSVLFGKGKFGLPNGMAWNLVRHSASKLLRCAHFHIAAEPNDSWAPACL